LYRINKGQTGFYLRFKEACLCPFSTRILALDGERDFWFRHKDNKNGKAKEITK
jgi:hypothetical protein